MKPIKDYNYDLSLEKRERTRKGLVYGTIIGVCMAFAGFSSAYIVSMGGSFWVKFPLPSSFYISTTVIAISSIFYILAIRGAKKDNVTMVRIFMILTLIFGILFCVFQFRGYKQLTQEGAYLVSPIMVIDGKYGDYYEVKLDNNFVEIDGNDYFLQGKLISDAKMKELQQYFKHFENIATTQKQKFSNLDPNITLYYLDEPLQLVNGEFIRTNGEHLKPVDYERLQMLAWNIRDGRGDFFHRGKYGKDFAIYFKGQKLDYKNRSLYYKGKRLSNPLQIKMSQAKDNATAYLYIITFFHLLHILVTLIYLIRMVILSFTGTLDGRKKIALKTGGIFWHFLGLLWLYLLLFLLFIH